MSDRDDWGPDCPTAPCEGPNCPACNPSCWCEWVDIGVGEQRVAETPGCPRHCPEPDPWPEVESAPDVRRTLDRMHQRCAECQRPGSSHKMDCATGRAEGLAKLREMRAAGLLPGYVPALGDPAPDPPREGRACPGEGDIQHLGCPSCRCAGCGAWVPQAEHQGGWCVGLGF